MASRSLAVPAAAPQGKSYSPPGAAGKVPSTPLGANRTRSGGSWGPAYSSDHSGDMASKVSGKSTNGGCSSTASEIARRQVRLSLSEAWQVPGAWLEIYKTNPAAKRIEKSSEVLQKLAELKEREEARKQPQPWIKSQNADILFAVVIIAYGLMTGVDVEVTVHAWPEPPSKTYNMVMLVAQVVFVIIFFLELLLHIYADGFKYCLPFLISFHANKDPRAFLPRIRVERCNPAGALDTAIIVISAAELGITLSGMDGALPAAGPLRLLRIVRLVRILKGLMVFEQLKLLCHGMLSSLSAVFWAFVLLAVLMYLGSLFCVILLGKNAEVSQYFGGVGQALFTHFMIVTLEAWPDISDDVMLASSPLWGIYFMVFICVSSLALMNLVTGVVCEKLLDVSRSDDSEGQNLLESFREDREQFYMKLRPIFEACDADGSETVNSKEFAVMLERSDMRRLLKLMEVSYNFDSTELFEILDARGKGELTFEELAESLLRLRGSQQRIHSLMLQRDIIQRHRREGQRVTEMEESLLECMKAELSAVEDTVTSKLEEFQGSVISHSLGCKHMETSPCYAMPQHMLSERPGEEPGNKQEVNGFNDSCPGVPPATCKQEPAASPEESCAQLQELEPTKQDGGKAWMKEAGSRLEALMVELDSLHHLAQELLVPEPSLPAASPTCDAPAPSDAVVLGR